jgi:hypothetical protein
MALTGAKVGSCLGAPLLAQLPLKYAERSVRLAFYAIEAMDEATSAFDANVLACHVEGVFANSPAATETRLMRCCSG